MCSLFSRSFLKFLNSGTKTVPVNMKHTFTVCVEGNIASGKTKLLEYFKKFSGIVETVEEPTKKWRNIQGHNTLAAMYKDPSRWGAVFQSYSQLTMLQNHIKPQTCPIKLMERSLYSGRYCFIENLKRSNLMPDLEYVVLEEWFNFLTRSNQFQIDLIVYLQTKPEVVSERIRSRKRPEEQSIPLKYLQDLHDLHEDWLIKKTHFSPPAPVLNTFYRYSIFSAIILGAIISLVPTYGYPSGAPKFICQNMTPVHPPTTTTGAAPFFIKVNSNSYQPGVSVKGVITSATKTIFRGFLLEARTTSTDEAYGKFIVSDNEDEPAVHTVCGPSDDAGLTHSDRKEKTEVMFEWMPPATPSGDLKFKLTVVESIKPSRYWLNIYSPTLSANTVY